MLGHSRRWSVLDWVSVLPLVASIDGGAELEPGPAIGCRNPCGNGLEKELGLVLVLASWLSRERKEWSRLRNGVVKRPWKRGLCGRDVELSCCASLRVCRGLFFFVEGRCVG